jgi:hypothetical protein
MQFLFYGSLMDRELLALVIGRATDGLRMEQCLAAAYSSTAALPSMESFNYCRCSPS